MKRPGQTRRSSAWSRRGSARPMPMSGNSSCRRHCRRSSATRAPASSCVLGRRVTAPQARRPCRSFLPLLRPLQTLPVCPTPPTATTSGRPTFAGCQARWHHRRRRGTARTDAPRPFLRPILVRHLCARAPAQHRQGARTTCRLRLLGPLGCGFQTGAGSDPEGAQGAGRRHVSPSSAQGAVGAGARSWPQRSPTRPTVIAIDVECRTPGAR